ILKDKNFVGQSLMLIEFEFIEYWNENQSVLLECGYLTERASVTEELKITDYFVTKSKGITLSYFNNTSKNKRTITVNLSIKPHEVFTDICARFHLIQLKTEEPLILEPISIPKPWGQEIWYTGIEKRGVSFVQKNSPIKAKEYLPYVLAVIPKRLKGHLNNKNIILLKILHPLSMEVFGDLYYELHTEKNEVYVVTGIDNASGVGKIKVGISPEKLSFYNNISEFKNDFLNACKKYYDIRCVIDAYLDKKRDENLIPLNTAVSPERMSAWCNELPEELRQKEKLLRAEMDSFKGELPLKVGDVISIPTHVPHSLCHGVRVIEFQTPTYERLILNFAQKVLTQNSWDIDEGFSLAKLEPPLMPLLPILSENEFYKEELVCSFKEFFTIRVTAFKKGVYFLKPTENYRLIFSITDEIVINPTHSKSQQITLKKEGAAFLSASTEYDVTLTAESCLLVSEEIVS
ncbi:MAG: hypothetical protein K2X39_01665, partial [Silvanigrellaceae bacterium]|nr:hypothetical protein [Silvanigrellaceae bacterium]